MKTKQIVGIVVAGLVFVFVCVSGVVSNYFSNQLMAENNTDIMSMLKGVEEDYSLPDNDFIGIVRVEGTITDTEASMFETAAYSHQATLDYVDEMMKSDTNKGILLYVDSPGGGVYESDELYLKLMEYKETTERPIWTYMASQACSGGYYISMASDKIVANRNCWTGSIGVIISLTNLKELYDKLGVKEIDITSGPNKAMGSQGQDMTQEQKDILQGMVDEAYEQFVGIVATGRKLDLDTVKKIADGRIYTAKQALNLGLIDGIDGYESMVDQFCDEVGGGVEMYEPTNSSSAVLSSLFSMYKGMKTKSDAQILSEYLENKGNGVLMYYMQNQEKTKVIYGGFFVRLAAYLVDIILMGILLLIVKVPFWIGALFNPNNIFQTSVIFHFSAIDILLYLLSVLYFVMLTYFSGATIGKRMFRLRVVTSDGSKLTLINVIYRETIGRYLSTVILWIGYFLIGVDTEKRGLHDLLCDTRVIYDFDEKEPKPRNIQPQEAINTEAFLEAEALIEAEAMVETEAPVEADTLPEEEKGLTQTSEKKYKAADYKYVKE